MFVQYLINFEIPLQQTIYSQIFHQFLYFPLGKKKEKKEKKKIINILGEHFNISENNIISVKLTQVLWVVINSIYL